MLRLVTGDMNVGSGSDGFPPGDFLPTVPFLFPQHLSNEHLNGAMLQLALLGADWTGLISTVQRWFREQLFPFWTSTTNAFLNGEVYPQFQPVMHEWRTLIVQLGLSGNAIDIMVPALMGVQLTYTVKLLMRFVVRHQTSRWWRHIVAQNMCQPALQVCALTTWNWKIALW